MPDAHPASTPPTAPLPPTSRYIREWYRHRPEPRGSLHHTATDVEVKTFRAIGRIPCEDSVSSRQMLRLGPDPDSCVTLMNSLPQGSSHIELASSLGS